MDITTYAFGSIGTVNQARSYVVSESFPLWNADDSNGHSDETDMTSEELIVGWGLLQMFGQLIRDVDEPFSVLPRKTLPERLASILLELGNDRDGIIQEITFDNLAIALDSHRETVASVLRAFRRQGLVDFGHRRILILDPGSLHEIGGEPDLSVAQ